MDNIFDKTGVMAIGTRLRLLSERVTKDAEKIYDLYDVGIKAKWYPVVFVLLDSKEPKTVTQIANEIGHSHVSVVKIVKEMSKAGFLIEQKDDIDKRKTNITLSQEGREKVKGLEYQHRDATLAVEKMLEKTTHNLWFAIEEFEKLLDEKSTYPRVVDEKRKRESSNVKIVEFEDKYSVYFRDLNKHWINKYFKIEEKDIKTLDNPKEYILDKGGKIFIALYNDKPVGVCALLKSENENYDYELAKMAIEEEHQGLGISLILGQEVIKKAKQLGGKVLYLESNTVLEPAINLYRKLGFNKIPGYSSPYNRCNIQMQLEL